MDPREVADGTVIGCVVEPITAEPEHGVESYGPGLAAHRERFFRIVVRVWKSGQVVEIEAEGDPTEMRASPATDEDTLLAGDMREVWQRDRRRRLGR